MSPATLELLSDATPALEQPRAGTAAPSLEIQELWLRLRKRPWTSLALIPAHPGLSLAALAESLARAGAISEGRPVEVSLAAALPPERLSQLAAELRQEPPAGLRLLVLDALSSRPQGEQVALAAGAALLAIELSASPLRAARHAIERIGRERFVGCVTLRKGD